MSRECYNMMITIRKQVVQVKKCIELGMKKSLMEILLPFFTNSCLIILIGISGYLLLRICLFDWFLVPSSSMEPLLCPGDIVIVNKLKFGARVYTDIHFDKDGQELKSKRFRGFRGINYNDVVVFNNPNHNKRICFVINDCFCKRCIGLPGDSISIVSGFYRNTNYKGDLGNIQEQGRLSKERDPTLINSRLIDKYFGWNLVDFGPLYVPTSGDMINLSAKDAIIYQRLLEWELSTKISWNLKRDEVYADGKRIETHQFKHSYYFMAGDNVLFSNDSRHWGLVPEEYIIGVVDGIVKKDESGVKIKTVETVCR